MSIFEIAVAPHRNAMRARYKDRPKNTTNGVGMITPLHSAYTESGVRRGGGLVLPDHSKAVSERPPYLRSATTPTNGDRQHFRANRK